MMHVCMLFTVTLGILTLARRDLRVWACISVCVYRSMQNMCLQCKNNVIYQNVFRHRNRMCACLFVCLLAGWMDGRTDKRTSCVCICPYAVRMCVSACRFGWMHVYVSVRVCVRAYEYVHVYVNAAVDVYVLLNINVYNCVCACIHVPIHVGYCKLIIYMSGLLSGNKKPFQRTVDVHCSVIISGMSLHQGYNREPWTPCRSQHKHHRP